MKIVFQTEEKVYRGTTALEIVRAMERDAGNFPEGGHSIRGFLGWSLGRLGKQIPPREMDLSDRMDDDALALNYLYLRDEYGAGKLLTDIDE
jgi:hypothetical protein